MAETVLSTVHEILVCGTVAVLLECLALLACILEEEAKEWWAPKRLALLTHWAALSETARGAVVRWVRA